MFTFCLNSFIPSCVWFTPLGSFIDSFLLTYFWLLFQMLVYPADLRPWTLRPVEWWPWIWRRSPTVGPCATPGGGSEETDPAPPAITLPILVTTEELYYTNSPLPLVYMEAGLYLTAPKPPPTPYLIAIA